MLSARVEHVENVAVQLRCRAPGVAIQCETVEHHWRLDEVGESCELREPLGEFMYAAGPHSHVTVDCDDDMPVVELRLEYNYCGVQKLRWINRRRFTDAVAVDVGVDVSRRESRGARRFDATFTSL